MKKKEKTKEFKMMADFLTKISFRDEMREILEEVLTESEMKEIPRRMEIVRLRKRGWKQREIAEKLGVSLATVVFWVREMRRGKFKSVV